MEKKWLKLMWLVIPSFCLIKSLLVVESYWQPLAIPTELRYDDVFFLNDTTGWAASGPSGKLYKTANGGQSWSIAFSGQKYLRSVEFLNELIGFSGSLDSSLYRTTDGGQTWVDISPSIFPKPVGICGLSIPDTRTVYGCGVFTGPAFIIKSVDAGSTWSYVDMSQYATALVDICFFNATTGFVVGKSNPETKGGIILFTIDGGASWKLVHQTKVTGDFVWKIQALNKKMMYASIAGLPASKNVRMLISNDAGANWRTLVVDNKYEYAQAVGFIDTLHGWVGGTSSLFETTNGGQSWQRLCIGNAYNRFIKVNDSTAFLSGDKIYKYTAKKKRIGTITKHQPVHAISASYNKVTEIASVIVSLKKKTHLVVDICTDSGKILRKYKRYNLKPGTYYFNFLLEDKDKEHHIVLRTNEGLITKKIRSI